MLMVILSLLLEPNLHKTSNYEHYLIFPHLIIIYTLIMDCTVEEHNTQCAQFIPAVTVA